MLLETAIQTTETKGTCLYAAILLKNTIERFCNCKNVLIRGGGPESGGGYRDDRGVLRGHYWVEAETADGVFVLDITADQFGGDPCKVLPIAEAGDRYVAGPQALVEDHIHEEFSLLNQELS